MFFTIFKDFIAYPQQNNKAVTDLSTALLFLFLIHRHYYTIYIYEIC